MKSRIILTGATGMVGEGVLHECLIDDAIEKVLIINRRPFHSQHPKLEELIVTDFFDLKSLQGKSIGYDAVFFCLGVSSVGMSKDEYFKKTYELTMNFANMMVADNPNLVFCYISGAGTDSSEQGKINWARVKGKTENDLSKLPFRAEYNFRPGALEPTKGLKNTLGFYKWLGWLIPLIRLISPNGITTLKELGIAMIRVAKNGYAKKIVEVRDIKLIAAGK
jgi:nucleoside-diphosphate-sugar epimerase